MTKRNETCSTTPSHLNPFGHYPTKPWQANDQDADVNVEDALLKMELVEVFTPDNKETAAKATKARSKAYSMRSCPSSSTQNF